MRILTWLLRLALFLVLLGLAIKNDGVVAVHFFFDAQWQTPLVVVMLLMFVLGALFGVTATVSKLFFQHREIRRLKRAADLPQRSERKLRVPEVVDGL